MDHKRDIAQDFSEASVSLSRGHEVEAMSSSSETFTEVRPPLESLQLNILGGRHSIQQRPPSPHIIYLDNLPSHAVAAQENIDPSLSQAVDELLQAQSVSGTAELTNAHGYRVVGKGEQPQDILRTVIIPGTKMGSSDVWGADPDAAGTCPPATNVAHVGHHFSSVDASLRPVTNSKEYQNNEVVAVAFPSTLFFQDLDEAIRHRQESRRKVPYIDPSTDNTIADVVANKKKWVNLLYNMMINCDEVRDTVHTQGYKKIVLNLRYSAEDVEAACHEILYEALDLCLYGCQLHEDLANLCKKNKDKESDFFTRMIKIAYALKHEKSICDEVLMAVVGDSKTKMFVNAPIAWRKRKEENRVGNWKKAENNRQMKDAKKAGKAAVIEKKAPPVIPSSQTHEEPPLNAVIAEAYALGIPLPEQYRGLLDEEDVYVPPPYRGQPAVEESNEKKDTTEADHQPEQHSEQILQFTLPPVFDFPAPFVPGRKRAREHTDAKDDTETSVKARPKKIPKRNPSTWAATVTDPNLVPSTAVALLRTSLAPIGVMSDPQRGVSGENSEMSPPVSPHVLDCQVEITSLEIMPPEIGAERFTSASNSSLFDFSDALVNSEPQDQGTPGFQGDLRVVDGVWTLDDMLGPLSFDTGDPTGFEGFWRGNGGK